MASDLGSFSQSLRPERPAEKCLFLCEPGDQEFMPSEATSRDKNHQQG